MPTYIYRGKKMEEFEGKKAGVSRTGPLSYLYSLSRPGACPFI